LDNTVADSQKNVMTLLYLRLKWPTRRFSSGYDDMSNPKQCHKL